MNFALPLSGKTTPSGANSALVVVRIFIVLLPDQNHGLIWQKQTPSSGPVLVGLINLKCVTVAEGYNSHRIIKL